MYGKIKKGKDIPHTCVINIVSSLRDHQTSVTGLTDVTQQSLGIGVEFHTVRILVVFATFHWIRAVWEIGVEVRSVC